MINKTITIASVNVRSLGSNSSKQKEVKSWVSSLAMPLQILLLQEHHLGETNCLNSTKGIKF
jgi:hypothetical protein